MTVGYISLGIAAFGLAIKYFAVLPGDVEEWNYMFKVSHRLRPEDRPEGERQWPASQSTR
jgi:hypothetical protein